MKWILFLLFAVSSLAHSRGELARMPAKPTEIEMRSLPHYCWIKMYMPPTSPEYQKTQQSLGKDFVHTHHFCMGMNYANRVFGLKDPLDKQDAIKMALTNYQYMIDHADQKFALMPDVYMQRGRLYMRVKQPGKALADFEKAADLSPGLIEAYQAQVKYYENNNKRTEALAVVMKGLSRVPDNETLRTKYVELGGEEPLPELSNKTTESLGPQITENGEPSSAKDVKDNWNGAGTPEKIGNQNNPWCRFCPDIANDKPAKLTDD